MITQTFDLNLIPDSAPVVVHCDQYDKGTGRLVISLYDGAVAYTPNGTAIIQGTKPDGRGFEYSASMSGNVVTANLTEQMSAVAGHVRCQIVVTESTGRTGTFVFILDVQKSALPADTDMSESEYQIIEEAIEEVQQAAQDASDFAEDAEAWAVGKRDGQDVPSTDPTYHNNSKYWADQASQYAQGGLHYTGSCLFANIPTSGMVDGDMWNIEDDFTTDSRFREGAGKFVPAGSNIAWIASNNKWDVLAMIRVSSLNDLTNVDITSPQNGQGLVYNATSHEWENGDVSVGDMTLITKGIGKPDGITTEVSSGTFSARGVGIVADVNSGGSTYGADWLYYHGTTDVITPNISQMYRVSINGQASLWYWSGTQYIQLTSSGGGGGGDYVGLYGMTEIQSSDGQGTTQISLNDYTAIGNYFCNGKAQIVVDYRSAISAGSVSSITISNAIFLLYVLRLPNDMIIQDLYVTKATDTSKLTHYRRFATKSGGTYSFKRWALDVVTESDQLSSTQPVRIATSCSDVNISSPTDGQILKYDSATNKWINAAASEGAEIDDTTTSTTKVWSSSKVNTELGNKANSTTVTNNNTAQNNKHKVTSKQVTTSGWTSDTSSQSGSTLYKKTITLSHVYVTSPTVEIGASGVLPTTAQQEAYDLLQYVTINGTTLTLYGSAVPTTAYYINIEGAD